MSTSINEGLGKKDQFPSLSMSVVLDPSEDNPETVETVESVPMRTNNLFCEDITNFATSTSVTYDWIKQEAKDHNLVVIQSGRDSGQDRVGFGLKMKVRKTLNLPRTSLFKFAKRKDGLYTYGSTNEPNV